MSRRRGISYMKYVNVRRTELAIFCIETAFYNGLLKERWKGGEKWQEDEEEDVGSYWMSLRKGEDTLIWRRKLWIALCGELALEEALDLSWDRLLNEWMNYYVIRCEVVSAKNAWVAHKRLQIVTVSHYVPLKKNNSCSIRHIKERSLRRIAVPT